MPASWCFGAVVGGSGFQQISAAPRPKPACVARRAPPPQPVVTPHVASELRFMPTLTTRRFASRAALDTALEQRLRQAIGASGASAIMLSGGTTPLPAYRSLAQTPPPHDEGLHIVFSDDRYVSSDTDASNYHQTRALLDALALPAGPGAPVRPPRPREGGAGEDRKRLPTPRD